MKFFLILMVFISSAVSADQWQISVGNMLPNQVYVQGSVGTGNWRYNSQQQYHHHRNHHSNHNRHYQHHPHVYQQHYYQYPYYQERIISPYVNYINEYPVYIDHREAYNPITVRYNGRVCQVPWDSLVEYFNDMPPRVTLSSGNVFYCAP